MSGLPDLPNAAALSQTAGVPDITVEMWEAGRAAYADWIFRTYRQGMPTEEDRDESARIAIAAMLAAAPAASGGECEICHGTGEGGGVDGDCALCGGKPTTSPAGASVSERARELLAAEYLDDPTLAEKIRAGTSRNGDVPRAIRALEQALTQQRGEPVPAIVREVLEWYASDPSIWVGWTKEGWAEEEAAKKSGHYRFIGEDNRGHNEYVPNHVRAEEALAAYDEWQERLTTTPQPGAEGLRDGYYLASFKRSHDRGYVTWWMANDAGYTSDLNQAGIYTELNPGYHDSEYTVPVPVSFIDRLRVRRMVDAGDSDNRALWTAKDLRAALDDELESLLARGG